MFKYATQYEYKDIQKQIFELNTSSNYYAFLYNVFGEYAGLLANPNYSKDMEEGVCYIKTHSLTNTFAKKCAKLHPESPMENKNRQKNIPEKRPAKVVYTTNIGAEGHGVIHNHEPSMAELISAINYNLTTT
jgi:hypothetical protein